MRELRSVKLGAKFTAEEAEKLQALAEATGMKLGPFIRLALLRPASVSRETALVLAEVGRTRELLTRLFSVQSEEHLDAKRVFEIAAGVEAVEDLVFVTRASKGKR